MYFSELVYTSIKIPVNEFYVKLYAAEVAMSRSLFS